MSDMPSQQPAPSEQASRKRPKWLLPVAFIVTFLIGIAVGGDSDGEGPTRDDGELAAAQARVEELEEQVAELEAAAESADDAAAEAPESEEPAEEPEPEPEPEPPVDTALPKRAQVLLFQTTFSDSRVKLAEAIEEDIIIDSVDAIRFDRGDEAVVIEATSGYSTNEFVEDEAWELTREISYLWGDEFWGDVERDPEWYPSFKLTANNLSWDCPPKLMRRLATRDASRSDWEDDC